MKEYKKRFSDKIAKMLDERIKKEGESAQLYKAMSTWFDMYGFVNLAKLYEKYSEEEREHMDKVYQFCLKMNYLPKTPQLDAQENVYESIEEILEKTYEHEMMITSAYKELAVTSLQEGDHVTRTLADEFLKEQVEEEDKALLLCDRFKSLNDCPAADFHFDTWVNSLL